MNMVIFYLEIGKIKLKMKKSKGLGDSIEKITEATRIKHLVEKMTKGDCGCDKRKEMLNKKFPYNK